VIPSAGARRRNANDELEAPGPVVEDNEPKNEGDGQEVHHRRDILGSDAAVLAE
jgi:hypothetical protein